MRNKRELARLHACAYVYVDVGTRVVSRDMGLAFFLIAPKHFNFRRF